jgi:hypothetical protein
MEKTIMKLPEVEKHAVVERSPCIWIQMRLPCLEPLLAGFFIAYDI